MSNIVKSNIANALTSVAKDHILGVAKDIYDEEYNVNGEYQNEINKELKERIDQLNTSGADTNASIEAEVQRATSAEAALTTEVNKKANSTDVYTKQQADAKFLTEHQDISNKADKTEIPTRVSQLTNDSKYQTEDNVNAAIQKVIGTAPEALDTLGEIADALNNNNDAIDAINGVLTGKANKSDTYTKSDIDTKVATINSSITTETNRATTAESTLNSAITTESNRAKAAEKETSDALAAEIERSTNKDTEHTNNISAEVTRAKAAESKLTTDLTTEVNRATNAEKALSDKIDVLNGNSSTAGSVANAIQVSKDYTDSEVSKAKTDAASKYQPKGDYLTEHQDISGLATKEELQKAVLGVDVTEQLKEYAKKTDIPSVEGLISKEQADDTYQPKGSYLTQHQDISHLASKEDLNIVESSIPTKLGQLTNDKNYQTQAQVNSAIQQIVGAAPEALDTLEEIAAKLSDNDDVVTGIINTLSSKADKSELSSLATKDELADAINDIDLTPYETVQGAASKYQPKGNYLTEHQSLANYPTKTEVSNTYETKANAVASYQPKGNYLTSGDISGLATKTEVNTAINEVNNKLQDYATKEELPSEYDDTDIKSRVSTLENADYAPKTYVNTEVQKVKNSIPNKVSQLNNDSGYITKEDIHEPTVIVLSPEEGGSEALEKLAHDLRQVTEEAYQFKQFISDEYQSPEYDFIKDLKVGDSMCTTLIDDMFSVVEVRDLEDVEDNKIRVITLSCSLWYGVVVPISVNISMYVFTKDEVTTFIIQTMQCKVKDLFLTEGNGIRLSDSNVITSYTPQVSKSLDSNNTIILEPNKLTKLGECANIIVELASPSDESKNDANEYMLEFISGNTPTILVLPSDVNIDGYEDAIGSNMKVQVSILNNLAIIKGWSL